MTYFEIRLQSGRVVEIAADSPAVAVTRAALLYDENVVAWRTAR